MRPAVFLDRDGVLNLAEVRDGKPYAPRHRSGFHLDPEALPALTRLNAAGYVLIVVTNQPDIGNRLVDPAEVAAMNAQLAAALPVAEVIVCPHAQTDGCACRKPRPGMLLDAARRHDIDLAVSVMVGDRAGDVAAGQAAGCRTIWIDRGYAEPAPPNPDLIVASLSAAVGAILANLRNTVSGDDIR